MDVEVRTSTPYNLFLRTDFDRPSRRIGRLLRRACTPVGERQHVLRGLRQRVDEEPQTVPTGELVFFAVRRRAVQLSRAGAEDELFDAGVAGSAVGSARKRPQLVVRPIRAADGELLPLDVVQQF